MRADVFLVKAGLFDSRAKAREAIEAGLVTANGVALTKPAAPVDPYSVLRASPAHPWVSRGGVKLAAALDAFGFAPQGRRCLDVGASTGGFTEVLLARGAAHVTAVDVGHGQLHSSLTGESRLTSLEGIDARELGPATIGKPPTLLTFDVSFISLHLVLPHVLSLASLQAEMVALVKPQFEAGIGRVRKGIVRDPSIHTEVCEGVRVLVTGLGWTATGLIASPIDGRDGNREFLLGATRP